MGQYKTSQLDKMRAEEVSGGTNHVTQITDPDTNLMLFRKRFPNTQQEKQDSLFEQKRAVVECFASKIAYEVNQQLNANNQIQTPEVNLEINDDNGQVEGVVSQQIEGFTELEDEPKLQSKASQTEGLGVILALNYLLQNPDANEQNMGVANNQLAMIDYGLSFYSELLEKNLLNNTENLIADDCFKFEVEFKYQSDIVYDINPSNILLASLLPQNLEGHDLSWDYLPSKSVLNGINRLNTLMKLFEPSVDADQTIAQRCFSEMRQCYDTFVNLMTDEAFVKSLKTQTYEGSNNELKQLLDDMVDMMQERAQKLQSVLTETSPTEATVELDNYALSEDQKVQLKNLINDNNITYTMFGNVIDDVNSRERSQTESALEVGADPETPGLTPQLLREISAPSPVPFSSSA